MLWSVLKDDPNVAAVTMDPSNDQRGTVVSVLWRSERGVLQQQICSSSQIELDHETDRVEAAMQRAAPGSSIQIVSEPQRTHVNTIKVPRERRRPPTKKAPAMSVSTDTNNLY